MTDSPTWFLDEQLMKTFLSRVGDADLRDKAMETAISKFRAVRPKTYDESQVGYLTAASPMGAERGRWMIRIAEAHYIPLMFHLKDGAVAIDPSTFEETEFDLASLPNDNFVDVALHMLILQPK